MPGRGEDHYPIEFTKRDANQNLRDLYTVLVPLEAGISDLDE